MHMNIGPHVADDVLEKYLLERLPEAQLASVEEHLLVCRRCQVDARETEEFILATRAALEAEKRKPAGRALRVTSAGFLHSWLSVPVLATVVAAVTAAIFIPAHRNPALPPSQVSLFAMRGLETRPVHVRAGGGLIMNLDATGLPVDGEYGVRVVDAHGGEVWTGVPRRLGTRIRAVLGIKLRPGRYWVRLTRTGELVREYGLQIE